MDTKTKYRKEAIDMLTNFRKSHNNAPHRTSFNRLTGAYANTKKDLIRDFKANWAMNQACYEVESGTNKKLMDIKLPEEIPDNPLID